MTFQINTPLGPAFQSPYGIAMLSDLFHADFEAGTLRWKPRSVEYFSSEMACAMWNGRYAGSLALSAVDIRGYPKGSIFNKSIAAHRVLFAMHSGHWPHRFTDHINGIRHDNRICNLREVTPTENIKNTAIRKNNTSGMMGVHWCKRERKWVATIRGDGKRRSLGQFSEVSDAMAARAAAEKIYGFHENHNRKNLLISG